MSRFDSAHMISYYRSIVTRPMALSATAELLVLYCIVSSDKKLATPDKHILDQCLLPILGGDNLKLLEMNYFSMQFNCYTALLCLR